MIRVLIRDCVCWSKDYALPEWRQQQCNLRRFKALYRKIQKLRHSTSKDDTKKREKEAQICEAHQAYIDLAKVYLNRVACSVEILKNTHKTPEILLSDLFLFQLHTEWNSKGKAGVPVELGIRMCIMQDTPRFILHHRVIQKETDDKIALEMVILRAVTDAGFYRSVFADRLRY